MGEIILGTSDGPKLRRRASNARKHAPYMDGASRHLHMIAEALSRGQPYAQLVEEPEFCGEAMLLVLADLWETRALLAALERRAAA